MANSFYDLRCDAVYPGTGHLGLTGGPNLPAKGFETQDNALIIHDP